MRNKKIKKIKKEMRNEPGLSSRILGQGLVGSRWKGVPNSVC